jgi:hypothetical protein
MSAIDAALADLHEATAELIAAAKEGRFDRFAELADRRGDAVTALLDAANAAGTPLGDAHKNRLARLDEQAGEAAVVLSDFVDRVRGALRELGHGRTVVEGYAREASFSRTLDQSV